MDLNSYNDNYYKRKIYNVGIYCRLSREDGDTVESNSISNQKNILTDYVLTQGWNLVDTYIDDGYTGLNFERPGFKRMIDDIEIGKISLVITKDMSRLGRDYITVGHYIQKFFPENGVRYIALNDNIDTEKDADNDIMPFKSIINDMYSKDISKKVRSVFASKKKEGKFIGPFAPYGYEKSIENKNNLVIDNEASIIVKRIFEMYLEGHGLTEIARKLNQEGVDTPSIYKRRKYKNYNNGKTKVNKWSHGSVKSIINNPVYTGCVTQNKYKKINYKSKKLKSINKEQWISVENTHIPIISKDKFDLVQELLENNNNNFSKGKRKVKKFSGFVYCGTCGQYMTYYKTGVGNYYLICSGYKRYGKEFCSRHSIKEDKLEHLILKNFNRIIKNNINNTQVEQYAEKEIITEDNIIDLYKNELELINKKIDELKNTTLSLYKDKVKGLISEYQFIEFNDEFNNQKNNLIKRQVEVQRKINKYSNVECERNKIEKLIDSVVNLKVLDRVILSEIVDSIKIYEDEDIHIKYKFNMTKNMD